MSQLKLMLCYRFRNSTCSHAYTPSYSAARHVYPYTLDANTDKALSALSNGEDYYTWSLVLDTARSDKTTKLDARLSISTYLLLQSCLPQTLEFRGEYRGAIPKSACPARRRRGWYTYIGFHSIRPWLHYVREDNFYLFLQSWNTFPQAVRVL